jgi:hypothetical protein
LDHQILHRQADTVLAHRDFHRSVNTRSLGILRQRLAGCSTLHERHCSGRWVDDHGVAEVFELGDQPSGMGLVVASAVPIGAQVVVGLIAFSIQ